MATTTGAIVTGDSDRPPPLPLDSIPIIDLSLLSQSELFSLSMCSNSSFDLNRCDDVVIPKIDRSVFNESAGSRKQTYSRLRLAPAESSSSTKATIHRRTSRLRASHAPTYSNITDPEQAENSQIIRMLKELFKSDHSFGEIVPVEVETDTNVVVPELLNPETSRKRGRPRKLESAVFIRSPAAKRTRNDMVMKVVTHNDDMDREMVNSNGVKVNLENLGRMEDPYGFEIRRRTEGLSTKDELLGFLRGLNGEWATSRKKRRVVDASNFGDALPKGWRLSLSIKKKVDRVWLFCRRYISPSGRQFESCKEVSTYLLSIVEEEKLHKPNHTQTNNLDDLASKGASVNANVFVQKDKTRNRPVVLALSASSPQSNNCNDIMSKGASVHMDVIVQEDVTRKRPVVLALSTSKKQVNSEIVGPIDVQVEEFFKCLNCFMIFEGKINLLDHQVLSHKTETSSEWTVVKGGIFECHFCNKTFHEMNQYNEHIGTHGTNETKTCEASEKTVDPVLFPEVPENVVMENHDATFDDKLLSSSDSQSDDKINSETESKINEPVHDLNMNEDVLVEESGVEIEKNSNVDDNEFPERDKTPDVSVSINETNDKFQSYDGTSDCVDDSGVIEKDTVVKSNGQDDTVMETVIETHEAIFGDKLTSDDEKISSGINSEMNQHVDELNDDNEDEHVNMNEDVSVEEFGNVDNNEASIFVNESNEKFESCVTTVDSTIELTESLEKNIVSESVNVEVVNVLDSETRVNSEEKGVNNSPKLQNSPQKVHLDEQHEFRNSSIEVNLDDFQVFKNNESITNEVAMGYDANDTGKNLEFCPLVVPPVSQQEFTFQDDDVTGLYESGHETSQRGFLDHFSITETFDDLFGSSKFDEDTTSLDINELNLPFGGDPHEQDSVVSSNTFDVQTDLSMVNNNSLNEDLNGDRQLTRDFSHNGNVVYPEVVANQQLFGDGFGLNGYRRSEENNPGSSGVFEYNNTGMQQGFGSDFWAGKNVGNMGGRNVITGVCGWCRNEFHVLPGTQVGVGSLCPTCSAGVNML